LILSLNLLEHFDTTNLLAANIILSPAAGFRPRLSRFSLTQNLPNPLIRTSSPETNLDLMVLSIPICFEFRDSNFGFFLVEVRCALFFLLTYIRL